MDKTWLILWKTARAVEVYAQRSIQELGLGLSDFAVMEALLHKGALPINALGSSVLLTSSSMTAAIDRLENQELVRRTDDPNDRRTRIVCLTPKGTKLITAAFQKHAADIEKVMAPLSQQEKKMLSRLLLTIRESANSLTE